MKNMKKAVNGKRDDLYIIKIYSHTIRYKYIFGKNGNCFNSAIQYTELVKSMDLYIISYSCQKNVAGNKYIYIIFDL